MTAILYDFDGLLIDSESAGLVSWQRIYGEFGCEVDMDHWLTETRAGRGPCMPTEILEGMVGKPIDWEETHARRLRYRDELLRTRPGVLEHLREAEESGMTKAIVSNAPDWWISQQLAHTGLADVHFDAVVTKSPELNKKPAPDAYLTALDMLGATAAEAVAFEDSPIGIDAAQAAGVRCVAVANSVTAHFDLSHADLVLPSLTARPLNEVVALLTGPGAGKGTGTRTSTGGGTGLEAGGGAGAGASAGTGTGVTER